MRDNGIDGESLLESKDCSKEVIISDRGESEHHRGGVNVFIWNIEMFVYNYHPQYFYTNIS